MKLVKLAGPCTDPAHSIMVLAVVLFGFRVLLFFPLLRGLLQTTAAALPQRWRGRGVEAVLGVANTPPDRRV